MRAKERDPAPVSHPTHNHHHHHHPSQFTRRLQTTSNSLDLPKLPPTFFAPEVACPNNMFVEWGTPPNMKC